MKFVVKTALGFKGTSEIVKVKRFLANVFNKPFLKGKMGQTDCYHTIERFTIGSVISLLHRK